MGTVGLDSGKSSGPGKVSSLRLAVDCRAVVKRFYRYEHRTRTMREFFIRSLLRRPIHQKRAEFSLQEFSLQVERGESVALIGRNGSGKSTALRLIAGIYHPSEGSVAVSGRLAAVIELGVGFHPELTGAENIGLYAAVMGLSGREITSKFDAIVAFADLGAFIHEPLKYCSSGMRARLAFAVAITCTNPDILLLDEVLAVGDEEFKVKSLQYLQDFHRNGGTLIAVSHDLDTLSRLCSRALWLEEGRVGMDGPIAQVASAYLASTGSPHVHG